MFWQMLCNMFWATILYKYHEQNCIRAQRALSYHLTFSSCPRRCCYPSSPWQLSQQSKCVQHSFLEMLQRDRGVHRGWTMGALLPYPQHFLGNAPSWNVWIILSVAVSDLSQLHLTQRWTPVQSLDFICSDSLHNWIVFDLFVLYYIQKC